MDVSGAVPERPPGREQLREAMRAQRGDAWHPFRVVANGRDDVAILLERTAVDRIERPSESPVEIASRIELLAAWDRRALVALARGWPRPRERLGHLWWREVWRVAARHLVAEGLLRLEDLDPVRYASERAILGASQGPAWSFGEAVIVVEDAPLDDVRLVASRPLRDTAIELARLEVADWRGLRLLRGHADRLTAEGRLLLARRALHLATRGVSRDLTLLLETLRAWDDASVEVIRSDMAAGLRRAQPSSELLEACMVLATSWSTP